MTFSEELLAWQTKHKLTQAQGANYLNTCIRNYKYWMSGKTTPTNPEGIRARMKTKRTKK